MPTPARSRGSRASTSRRTSPASATSFVRDTVGVDNVCERAALAEGGRLLVGKTVRGQATAALTALPQSFGFSKGDA